MFNNTVQIAQLTVTQKLSLLPLESHYRELMVKWLLKNGLLPNLIWNLSEQKIKKFQLGNGAKFRKRTLFFEGGVGGRVTIFVWLWLLLGTEQI